MGVVVLAFALGCSSGTAPEDLDVRPSTDVRSDVRTDVGVDTPPGMDVQGTDGSGDVTTTDTADAPQDTARNDVSAECVPVPEVCNGMDDDCDGMVDEDLGSATCGRGECRRTEPSCVAGSPRTCRAGTPTTEICDGLDNNCDGMTDEGLGQTTCGVGACLRTVDNCSMGTAVTCTPGRAVAEICDGIDNNCDGSIDEGLGMTSCGIGGCARTVQNCMAGRPQSCMPGAPMTETCNGMDDNCDGSIDEGLGTTMCGMGACRVSQQNCVGGMTRTCTPRMPTTEVCNGMDDNCDGMTDEGLAPLTCGRGQCLRTVVACMAGVPQTCIAGMPGAEICDGLDNDCDGVTDNGDPGGGGACTSGSPGVCMAGTFHCSGGMVRCVPNVAPMSRPETCDGLDNNCDGLVDNLPIAMLCPPPAAGVMTMCAGTMGCVISGCPSGRFDVDGNPANGCECVDDTNSNDCAAPTNLGTLSNIGDRVVVPASGTNRVPPANGEDWYRVDFTAPAAGTQGVGAPHIQLTVNGALDFRFDVRTAACPGAALGCASGIQDWQFADNTSGAGWTSRNTAWPATVYIRVFRMSSGASCQNYELTITR